MPFVVNTSFNDSEPIVCTPTDAIVTFRKSGIDALFMDDVVLTAAGLTGLVLKEARQRRLEGWATGALRPMVRDARRRAPHHEVILVS